MVAFSMLSSHVCLRVYLCVQVGDGVVHFWMWGDAQSYLCLIIMFIQKCNVSLC